MQKTCPKCGTIHDKSGTYCSRKCANSRQWSTEHKARLSDAAKIVMQNRPADIIKASTDKARSKFVQNALDRFETSDIEKMSPYLRKRRVLNEQNGCCLHCGIHEWNGGTFNTRT